MRIGFFTDCYFPRKDGASYTIRTWKRRLEDRGHEVHLYYPESTYEPGEKEHPMRAVNNPFHYGHYWPLPDLSGIEEDLDAVHCHSPWLICLRGLMYARSRDVPAIYTYHSPIQEYADPFLGEALAELARPAMDALDRWWLSRFDTVTCSADAIPVDVEYEQVPVGVDADFFRPTDEQPFQMPDSPVIGYSGRISEEKNLEKLLELARRTDWSFVIVGEGRYRAELEEESPENVQFHDYLDRDDLPKFYSSIDVFLTASTADTFSLTTMEANLCGTPVVAPDVEPFNETVREENGERYELSSLESMESAVQSVFSGEYATRDAAKKFSVEKTIDRLEELYEDLET